MKKELKGTKTEQNLINAFAGESMARNRYTFFASIAKEEGYEQIAEIFCMTAENEKEHAEILYEYIGDTEGHVNAIYPFKLGTTEENLESAIAGEHEEWAVLYEQAEQTAREEGFDEIADSFHHIINAEKHHENRYQKLYGNIKNETVFKKDKEVHWMCRKCGYLCESKCAPNKCTICEHEKSYFEVLCENY